MVERLAPSGYMRYAPDGRRFFMNINVHLESNHRTGHFVFASFASAFLLKVGSIKHNL